MAQLMLLQDRSCDLGQGFLLSRPLHPTEALQLLRRAAREDGATATQRLKRLIA
jgi:EAL domain-containing protein (putative c-di-GMP-specific phosphodiesterase class I)